MWKKSQKNGKTMGRSCENCRENHGTTIVNLMEKNTMGS
jgi:hypothetical protein